MALRMLRKPERKPYARPVEYKVGRPCRPKVFIDEQSQQIIINLYTNLLKRRKNDDNLAEEISALTLVSLTSVKKIIPQGNIMYQLYFYLNAVCKAPNDETSI